MATRTLVVLTLLMALVSVDATAQDFTSADAKAAKAEYESGIKQIDEVNKRGWDKVRDDYVINLRAARKAAPAKDKLDEATRIVTVIKELEEDDAKPGTTRRINRRAKVADVAGFKVELSPLFRSRLTLLGKLKGTVWQPSENAQEIWLFDANGTGAEPGGSGITWAPIDAYRIAVCFPNGAVDIIRFDSELTAMDYFLGPRPNAKPKGTDRRVK